MCASPPKLIQLNKLDQCIESLKNTVSHECTDLLRQMLVVDPTNVSILSDACIQVVSYVLGREQ